METRLTAGKQGNTTQRRGRGGPGRKKQGTTLDVKAAKQRVLELIEAGHTVESACKAVDRSIKTYEYWRRNDEDFRNKIDLARSTRKSTPDGREAKREAAKEMGFAAWRRKYLGQEVPWHQQQWIDLIEGREPQDIHDAQTYERGRRNRIIINTPPFHGKSMTISVDYVAYRICCDPSVRIRIISKTATLAQQFLGAVKMRLTHARYAELIKDFAPEGGFRATAENWTQDCIFLDISDRDGVEKDPTVQAAGIGKQIYGVRADLIILDDAVDLENAGQHAKQMIWLSQEVDSRLGPAGKILVVGTRVEPIDLYKELRNGDHFASGKSPWTYLSQPGILEESEDPKGWKTLWPEALESWGEECDCEQPECHVGRPGHLGEREVTWYPRWDGVHLSRLRDTWQPRRFALVFQQNEIPDDSTFPQYAVMAAINKRRRHGMSGGLEAVPPGCYWILSMDPATSGPIGALIYAVDPKTMMRYLVNAVNPKNQTPTALKNLIKRWCNEYPIKEVVVEKTGLNTYFTQDAELRSWIAARGIRFTPHYTSGNKWDEEWGVGSMGALFGAWDKDEDGMRYIQGTRKIELPTLDHAGLQALVQQLMIWSPELDPKKTACDLVMALWFAECAALRVLKPGARSSNTHQRSRWLSPMAKKRQGTIRLSDGENRAIA